MKTKPKSKKLMIAMPLETITRVEEWREEQMRNFAGIRISFTEAVRALINRGLER